MTSGFGNLGESLGCGAFRRYMNGLRMESNHYVDEAYTFFAQRYSRGDGVRYYNGLFQRGRERLFKRETFLIIRSQTLAKRSV